MKEVKNATANVRNEAAEVMQDKMQKATEKVVTNILDRAAEEIGVYAETPISLSVTASSVATGSVGDIWVNMKSHCNGMLTNDAYRASVIDSTLAHSYFTPNSQHVYVPSVSCPSKEQNEKMPAECNGCNIPADEKDCRACGYSDIDGNCPSASCSSKEQNEKMPAEEKEYDHSEYYKAESFAKVPEFIKQEFKGWGCVSGKSEECKDCTGCCLPVDDDHSELKDQPVPVTSEKTLADFKDAPFAEKMQHDYYNRALKEGLETSEDVLVNILTALQYLKKFESLEFTNSHVWINGDECHGNIAHYLEKFDVDLDDAKAIAFQISDCMGLDIFKVIAKNKKVYIVAGNVETGVETYDSSTGKNSKAFVMNVLAKK